MNSLIMSQFYSLSHLTGCIGHHFFTIGQRARVGGQPAPYFVACKDSESSTVTVVCRSPLIQNVCFQVLRGAGTLSTVPMHIPFM